MHHPCAVMLQAPLLIWVAAVSFMYGAPGGVHVPFNACHPALCAHALLHPAVVDGALDSRQPAYLGPAAGEGHMPAAAAGVSFQKLHGLQAPLSALNVAAHVAYRVTRVRAFANTVRRGSRVD